MLMTLDVPYRRQQVSPKLLRSWMKVTLCGAIHKSWGARCLRCTNFQEKPTLSAVASRHASSLMLQSEAVSMEPQWRRSLTSTYFCRRRRARHIEYTGHPLEKPMKRIVTVIALTGAIFLGQQALQVD